jgi:hypothetical protein
LLHLLHDKYCIDGNITFQLELHLQQTFLLLCLELYKHPKTIELNLNTTKEESNGNKLPLLLHWNIITKEDDNA